MPSSLAYIHQAALMISLELSDVLDILHASSPVTRGLPRLVLSVCDALSMNRPAKHLQFSAYCHCRRLADT